MGAQTDAALTFVAAAFELGLPLTIVVLCVRRPGLRSALLVPLGALTPLVLFLLYCWAGSLSVPPNAEARWAAGAVWEMSFAPYVVIAAIGFAVALVKVPKGLVTRYLVGCGATGAVAATAFFLPRALAAA